MERLVVTGGSGFIGSNFIHHIIASRGDVQVTNIDYLGPSSSPSNLKHLRNSPHYTFVKADIADPQTSKKIPRNTDVVINFAAETHVDRSIANPQPFLHSNVLGVSNLLQHIGAKVRKFIHISTDEVYGSLLSGSFTEESALNPSSPYSASKAAGDLIARAWHTTHKAPVVILRCTNNFGPYQHPEKLIPKTIIRAQKDKTIPLYGSGSQVRDWIFVKDFCRAIEKALDRGEPGEIYNVSGGNELTNREIVERVLKQLEKPIEKIVSVDDRPGHDFRYSLSSEKARRQLGWQPEDPLDQTLSQTVDWYMKNSSWWKPLATSKVLSEQPWKEKW